MTENSKAECEIIEYLATRTGWTRIEAMAADLSIADQNLKDAIIELHSARVISTTTDSLMYRVSRRAKELAPVIGAEARHFVKLI